MANSSSCLLILRGMQAPCQTQLCASSSTFALYFEFFSRMPRNLSSRRKNLKYSSFNLLCLENIYTTKGTKYHGIHYSVCGYSKKLFWGLLCLRLKSLYEMVPKSARTAGHGFHPWGICANYGNEGEIRSVVTVIQNQPASLGSQRLVLANASLAFKRTKRK